MDTKASFVEKTSSFSSRQSIIKNSPKLLYNLWKVSKLKLKCILESWMPKNSMHVVCSIQLKTAVQFTIEQEQ